MKRVTLIGVGPGDKGLLTLKGAERLSIAEVVLYDRFVGEGILSLIPDEAEKIDVGKKAGNHPVPQEEINSLLLEKAQEGREVVCLKGGDPFVFGRGGEELELLAEHDIPFEVIPGISAAIAGPAYAGIPVTHREYASSLHIITGHGRNNEQPSIDYEALGRAGGISPQMPALARQNQVESPALIVIGQVCLLSEDYDWFGNKPLLGKSIIVARAKPGPSRLTDGLRERGCVVTELLPPEIAPLKANLQKAFQGLGAYSWLVFTSVTGVKVSLEYLFAQGLDARSLAGLGIACVGAETARELAKYGLRADYFPHVYNGVALANGLCRRVCGGERILLLRAKDSADDLTRILREEGISFDDMAVYEKAKIALSGKIDAAIYDAAAFTSASAVERFVAGAENYRSLTAVCIGESTAAAAKRHNMSIAISEKATIDSMLIKIEELLAENVYKNKKAARQ